MKKNNITQNRGITLIALVITIIVMLILVAVTINMAVNGGLFDYASRAARETNEKMEQERELANVAPNLTTDALIAKYTGKSNAKKEIKYVITDLENGFKGVTLSVTNYITREELEKIVEENYDDDYSITMREQYQQDADRQGLTYEEYLKMALEDEGIPTAGLTINQLEEEMEEILLTYYGLEVSFNDSFYRWQSMIVAEYYGMTYEEYLTTLLEAAGLISPPTYEVTNKDNGLNINVEGSSFMATSNGTYSVVATTADGEKIEQEITISGII